MGGDLNFSLGLTESWDHNAQVDSLTDFFEQIMESNNLIDTESAHTQPTWNMEESQDWLCYDVQKIRQVSYQGTHAQQG